MQKMILEIFDRVNIEIPDMAETEKELEEQVEALSEIMQKHIPQEYHEYVDSRLFEAANIAERRGFELGMKCMAKLIFESLS
ncbi:MAG: hypothetical protein HFH76_16230 [Lachnospiraceae bacterium]|jgi:hypothetical protein|nr:hypothetical protein [Lachnospiraceae bacterium]